MFSRNSLNQPKFPEFPNSHYVCCNDLYLDNDDDCRPGTVFTQVCHIQIGLSAIHCCSATCLDAWNSTVGYTNVGSLYSARQSKNFRNFFVLNV